MRSSDECPRLTGAQIRFRAAITNTNCMRNRCLCLDLMKLDNKNVLQTVDKDASFQQLAFSLKNYNGDMGQLHGYAVQRLLRTP